MSASGIKVTTEKRNGETMTPPAPSCSHRGCMAESQGKKLPDEGMGNVLSGSGKRLKVREGLCSRTMLVGSPRPKLRVVAHASDPSTQEA